MLTMWEIQAVCRLPKHGCLWSSRRVGSGSPWCLLTVGTLHPGWVTAGWLEGLSCCPLHTIPWELLPGVLVSCLSTCSRDHVLPLSWGQTVPPLLAFPTGPWWTWPAPGLCCLQKCFFLFALRGSCWLEPSCQFGSVSDTLSRCPWKQDNSDPPLWLCFWCVGALPSSYILFCIYQLLKRFYCLLLT
jgi:hypothetical protein